MSYYNGFGAGKLSEDGDYVSAYEPTPPPMVAAQVNTPSAGFDWQNLVGGVGRGLLDIFGRPVQQTLPTPPPKPAVPVWIWLAVPVALLGVVALTRRRSSVAGYRKRKSRKSRR